MGNTIVTAFDAAAGLSIRPALPTDADGIVKLLRMALGEGSIPRSEEYWTWKHHLNPFGPSAMLVAEESGEIVGLRAFMRWRFNCGKRKIEAVRAVDTATHPAWRGRGIFRRLTLALADQLRHEGVAFVFNTPNSQSRPGYLRMGWRSCGRPSVWIRPIRPVRVALAPLAARAAPSRAIDSGESADVLLGWDRTPSLLRTVEVGAPLRLRTPRSIEYVTWRYISIPGFDYRVFRHEERGHAAAAIVRYRQWKGVHEIRVSEMLTSGGHGGLSAARHALSSVVGAGADLASLKPLQPSVAAAAVMAGFTPVPRLGPVVTVRGLAEVEVPRNHRAWQMGIGDLEIF